MSGPKKRGGKAPAKSPSRPAKSPASRAGGPRADRSKGPGSRGRAPAPGRGKGGAPGRRPGPPAQRTERGLDGTQVEGRHAVRELLLAGTRKVKEVLLAVASVLNGPDATRPDDPGREVADAHAS